MLGVPISFAACSLVKPCWALRVMNTRIDRHLAQDVHIVRLAPLEPNGSALAGNAAAVFATSNIPREARRVVDDGGQLRDGGYTGLMFSGTYSLSCHNMDTCQTVGFLTGNLIQGAMI